MPLDEPVGEVQQIPPVVAPKTSSFWSWQRDERDQLEKDGSQIHNVRRLAAYGGLVVAAILYTAGLAAITLFLGLIPPYARVDAAMWHIVVAVLVALFTVPTVIVIAVLKVTSRAPDAELPATMYEAMGKMVEKVVDRICA